MGKGRHILLTFLCLLIVSRAVFAQSDSLKDPETFSIAESNDSAFNSSVAVSNVSPDDLFARANSDYDSSKYIEAIEKYNRILIQGHESAELYFNLGNAYFESGDLGHAILNYLRAERLDPNDQDIQDNLAFARSFVSLQLEGVQLNPFGDFVAALVSKYSLNFWGWLSTALLFVLCAVVYVRVAQGRALILNVSLWSAIVIFISVAGLTTFKYRTEFSPDRGVVVMSDIPVTNKPSSDGDLEFEAVAGLEVEIRDQAEGHVLARFANKRQGWLPVSAIARL